MKEGRNELTNERTKSRRYHCVHLKKVCFAITNEMCNTRASARKTRLMCFLQLQDCVVVVVVVVKCAPHPREKIECQSARDLRGFKLLTSHIVSVVEESHN